MTTVSSTVRCRIPAAYLVCTHTPSGGVGGLGARSKVVGRRSRPNPFAGKMNVRTLDMAGLMCAHQAESHELKCFGLVFMNSRFGAFYVVRQVVSTDLAGF